MKNRLLLTTAFVLACAGQINAETPYRTQELTFNQQTEQAIVNLLSGQANHFNISNQAIEAYIYHLSNREIIALAQANLGLVQALHQLELAESAEFVSRVLQVPTEKNIEPRDTHDPSFIVTADTVTTVQPTTITVPLSPKSPTNEPPTPAKDLVKARAEAKPKPQILNKLNKLASKTVEVANNAIKESIETAVYYSEALNNAGRTIIETTLETVQEGVEEAGHRIKTLTDSIPTNQNQTQAIAEKDTAKTQHKAGVGVEAQALAAALDKYNAVDREMTKAINQYNAAIESGAETQVVTAALDRLNAVTQKMTQAAGQYNAAVEAQKAADAPNKSENSEKNAENNNTQPSMTEHETPTSQSEKVADVDTDQSNSAETEEQDNSSHTHEEASNDNNNDSTTDTTYYADGNEFNVDSRSSSPVTYNADIDDYSDIDHPDDTNSANTNISNATNIGNFDVHDVNAGDYDSLHDSGSSPNIDNSGLSSIGGAVGAGIGISAGDGGDSDSGLSSVGNVGIGISIGGSTVGIGGGAVGAGLGISVDNGGSSNSRPRPSSVNNGAGSSGAVGASISVSTGGAVGAGIGISVDATTDSSNSSELSSTDGNEIQ